MALSRITSSNMAGESPQAATSAQVEAPTHPSTPPASPPGLPARNMPATSQAASPSPRASLRMGTEFLQTFDAVTLGRQDQHAALTQWLQLPEARLKEVINSQDENGDSALHKLAKSVSIKYVHRDDVCKDAPDLMRSLLNKGADPRLVNHAGKTPAHYVDRATHIVLAPRVSYEIAHAGPLNQQRLHDNHAAFVADPAQSQALAGCPTEGEWRLPCGRPHVQPGDEPTQALPDRGRGALRQRPAHA